MFGKIINGELQMAGEVLITKTEQIFNAKPEMWLAHGWKPVYWDSVEDIENQYVQILEETENSILVHWEILEVVE